MENLIEVRGLSKRFGNLLAVDDLSLDVRRGDVLGFLGPNAAGKSTTMKMITGFLPPTAGSIRVCGHDVASDPIAAKAQQGYLPEGAPAYGEMTPAGFLDFIADIRGLKGADKNARVRDAIAKIHLETVLHQTIETLSKGFKRRVGLAQAILHDPPVLILDEPTDGLDPNQKHEVRTLIRQMAPNKAIVISTHILEEVDAVCGRAVIIAHGRIVFSGTPADLASRSRYRDAVTLTVDAAQEAAIRTGLGAIDEVAEIEACPLEGDAVKLTVIPHDGRLVADSVLELVRDQGWRVNQMVVESGRLDEVFRTITAAAGRGGEADRT